MIYIGRIGARVLTASMAAPFLVSPLGGVACALREDDELLTGTKTEPSAVLMAVISAPLAVNWKGAERRDQPREYLLLEQLFFRHQPYRCLAAECDRRKRRVGQLQYGSDRQRSRPLGMFARPITR